MNTLTILFRVLLTGIKNKFSLCFLPKSKSQYKKFKPVLKEYLLRHSYSNLNKRFSAILNTCKQ